MCTQTVPATKEECKCRRKQAYIPKGEYDVLGNQIFKSLKTLGAIQNDTHFIIYILHTCVYIYVFFIHTHLFCQAPCYILGMMEADRRVYEGQVSRTHRL